MNVSGELLSPQEIKDAADALNAQFTITCGKCGLPSPSLDWTETPISGELPIDEYQCPKCGEAFRRQRFAGDPWRQIKGRWEHRAIDLIPISPRL